MPNCVDILTIPNKGSIRCRLSLCLAFHPSVSLTQVTAVNSVVLTFVLAALGLFVVIRWPVYY